jgi:hypothetical protein
LGGYGFNYTTPYALCAMRQSEEGMPAIASLEDLKAAQKDTLSIYLRYLSSEVLEGMT